MISAFGFFGVHATALHRDEQACAKLAALFVDRRWPWPLALVRPTQKPGAPPFPWPKGKLAPAKLEEEARAILRSDSTRGFHGTASRADALNHVFAHVEVGGGSDALANPHGHEVARIAGARRELGARWIRPAEWGTYLSATHVNEIGREQLVAAAATSREVGSLLYVQCSGTSAEAFTAEAEARRQALRTLLAPITV